MPSQLFHEHQYIVFDATPDPGADEPDLQYDGYTVRHFTGQSFGLESLIEGDFSVADREYPPVSSLADSMGEWVAVADKEESSGRQFIIFSDTFGYGSVFYARIGTHKLVISDSFNGVASALDQAGVHKNINFSNYISTITSRLSQFQNAYSDQTMIEEIRILRPDQFIHVSSKSGVSFRQRSEIGTASKLVDYDSTLQAGLALAVSVLRSISAGELTDKRITLSGGVDSRIVLAMLVASEGHKSFAVHSVDPRTWQNENTRDVIERDIELADLIRRDYGMQWWKPGGRSAVATSFRESLSAYQSHRSNLYYLFRPAGMLTFYDTPTVTLRGGGGETLSSTSGSQRMARLYSEDNSEKTPEVWLSHRLTKSAEVIPEYKEMVRHYIRDIYQNYEHSDLPQSLNKHYFHTRNRAHFGHLRHSKTSNDLAVHMLSNPFFLRAANLLDFSDRAEGKLVSDIFSAAEPQLLGYLFDSEYWSEKLVDVSKSPKDATSGSWRKEYDTTHSGSPGIQFVQGRERTLSGNNGKFDDRKVGENYLKSALALIEELVPVETKKDLMRQHSLILSRTAQGRLNLFQGIAKATSVLDGFFPQPALGAKIIRSCSRQMPLGKLQFDNLQANRLAITVDEVNDLPIFEQSPSLEIRESEFIIKTNLSSFEGTEYQFAFYLIRDGKRIAERWYESGPCASFKNEFGSGVYHGISHVRYKGRSVPTYYAKTNVIEI